MPQIKNIADIADPLSDHIKDEQLSKELSCGITQLVSPQVAGFAGTLKKRCFFLRPRTTRIVLTPTTQVYRFSC